MSRKGDLKKQIEETESEIAALEAKRARSQSALLEAMLMGKKPNSTDERYFKVFTSLINDNRVKLRGLMKELEELTNK